MDHNPFRASKEAHQVSPATEKPVWIYIWTVGSFFSVAGLPILFCVRAILIGAQLIAVGISLSFLAVGLAIAALAAWRVWRRLSGAYEFRLEVEQKRQALQDKYTGNGAS